MPFRAISGDERRSTARRRPTVTPEVAGSSPVAPVSHFLHQSAPGETRLLGALISEVVASWVEGPAVDPGAGGLQSS